MTQVQITPGGGDSGSYIAAIDGVRIPVATFAVEPSSDGRVMVSLVVAADQVQVGQPPARPNLEQTRIIQEPPRRNEPPRSTWGDPAAPDPRANIPGWAPPPAGADAGRGATGEYPPVASHRRPK